MGLDTTILRRITTPTWANLPTALLPGAVAQWNFDGVITESIGSLDFAHVAPATDLLYTKHNGLYAFAIDGVADSLERPSNDAALTITGTLSIWVLIQMRAITAATQQIVTFQTAGETLATNTLYELFIAADTGRLGYFAEYGSGGDNIVQNSDISMPLDQCLVNLSRSAAGAVTFRVNDLTDGPYANTAPTGGTSSILVTSNPLGLLPITGFMGGLAICNEETTDAEYSAVLQRVRL